MYSLFHTLVYSFFPFPYKCTYIVRAFRGLEGACACMCLLDKRKNDSRHLQNFCKEVCKKTPGKLGQDCINLAHPQILLKL